MKKLEIKPAGSDKGSRLTDKHWTVICDQLRSGACPHLECIHLPGNVIGCAGMEALVSVYQQGSIKRCMSLDLSGNCIGDKGAVALARIFDDTSLCESLQLLDLSQNHIHSKGFDALLMHFGAMKHKCLHTLVLAHNSPKPANIQCLCRVLENGCCPKLHCLDLSGLPLKAPCSISFASLIRSGTFKGLEELRLNDCCLNVESLEHIARAVMDSPLQMLKTLCLAQNRFKQQSIQLLAAVLQRSCLPSLACLDLSCNCMNDTSLQELNNPYNDAVLEQVEVLDLSDNLIGNEGAFMIFDNVRHRQWASLRDLNLERTDE